MHFVADLHIHSHYSMATSKQMNPENIYKWAQLKGITVVGSGDFTHPGWLGELKEKVEPAELGLYRLKDKIAEEIIPEIPESCRSLVRFILTAEVSCIYKKNGRTRKNHNLIFVPNFHVAQKIQTALSRIGNIKSDGRPILGFGSKELLKLVKNASEDAFLVPAHAWTPHFSIFGAISGFDSLEECFEELTPLIPAIETGLSSDPAMNWRLTQLDGISLISNSDAHSPAKLMRNANLFDTELSYQCIIDAICHRDSKKFLGTLEFFPQEGKYHYDGHRSCQVCMSPKETIKQGGRCPKCGGKVIIGVMHRVEELADREEGYVPSGALPFKSAIPLAEILSEVLKVGVNTLRVKEAYERLLSKVGNEYHILLEAKPTSIEKASSNLVAEAIRRMREGRVKIAPGYDGQYGTVEIFTPNERMKLTGQLSLFS